MEVYLYIIAHGMVLNDREAVIRHSLSAITKLIVKLTQHSIKV